MTLRSEFAGYLEERLRPSRIDMPGFSRGCIAVRLLTDSQVSEAKIEAFRYLEKVCKDANVSTAGLLDADSEVFERERQIQVVYRAFVDGEAAPDDDDPNPAFRSASAVRDLDTATVDAFHDAYANFAIGKTVKVELDAEAISVLVAALKEPGSESLLAALDDVALRLVIVHLARRD